MSYSLVNWNWTQAEVTYRKLLSKLIVSKKSNYIYCELKFTNHLVIICYYKWIVIIGMAINNFIFHLFLSDKIDINFPSMKWLMHRTRYCERQKFDLKNVTTFKAIRISIIQYIWAIFRWKLDKNDERIDRTSVKFKSIKYQSD